VGVTPLFDHLVCAEDKSVRISWPAAFAIRLNDFRNIWWSFRVFSGETVN
jgi:hypothetical protein